MALQKITDAAGREAYYDQAADRVFTEGGNNDTYYNLNDWNARQTKKYGSSSPSTNVSSGSSSGGGNIGKEFSDIYKNLSGMFGNSSMYGDLLNTGKDIKNAAKDASNAIKGQIPAVQNIYAKLAEELKMQLEKETASLEQSKAADTGRQDAEAARSGFETGTGYEASMRRNLEGKYNTAIDTKADEWQIDRERLASEEIKDIKQLEAEAAKALMDGNVAYADITSNIIQLKNQESQIISSAASNLMNTADNREKMYYDRLYNDALLEIKERELDLQAQKINIDASSGSKDRVQVVTGADGKLYKLNLDTNEVTPFDVEMGVDISETQRKEQARALIIDDIKNGVDSVKELGAAYPEFTPDEIEELTKAYKSNAWQKFWGK